MLFNIHGACFFHGGKTGDIIYSIPTVIVLGGGSYWVREPNFFNYVSPLLAKISCIKRVGYWWGPPEIKFAIKNYDLDQFRPIAIANLSMLLTTSHLKIFGVDFDLTLPWIFVNPKHVTDIVISVTDNFHYKEPIDWQLLRGYDLGFIGFDSDYNWFYEKTKLEMKRIYVQNALETAQIIRGSKLFLGNQSSGFAIAEAMKHPRVLEVDERVPNCMPQGKDGYTFLSEELIDKYVGDNRR